MKISTGLRVHQLVTGSFKTAMDGATLKFYGSPTSQAAADALIPATADAAIGSATLMCTGSVGGTGTGMTFEATAPSGVLSKTSAESLTGTLAATGYYSFARLVLGSDTGALSTTEKRAQFDVGTVNADVIVNSMYKTLGDAQPITSFFIAQPGE